MLALKHVHKSFQNGKGQVTVLRDINVTISDGDLVAITGPSGSGKSSLLNVLGCLDAVTTGVYEIDGRPVSALSNRALARLRNETFGFVFQFFGLASEYNALENVMLPLLYRGIPFGAARRSAANMLEQLGIADLSQQRPDQLSGGQQQRVAIARALVGNPRVILADEPTGSLDSVSGAAVMKLLQERHRMGQTVIVVTHSAEVTGLCQRVLTIRDGILTEPVPSGLPGK